MDRPAAFRLNSHNLARRLPPGSLLPAVRASPLQNAAPGAALLSLHARVEGIRPADLPAALDDRSLVMTYSLRGAAYLMARQDFPIFTLGPAPEDEVETRHFIRGAVAGLEKIGLSARDLVDLAAEGLGQLLDGRGLDRDDLGRALGQWIGARLPGGQVAAWNGLSDYAPGQTLGESLARFALYVTALRGCYCLAPTSGEKTLYVRADQWLNEDPPQMLRREAGGELARRFLHAFGPGSVEGLSAWSGVHPLQARRLWESITDDCAPVEGLGNPAWLLREDLSTYQSAPQPTGARFLPPHDPYLSLPDRAALVADRAWQRRIWRAIGNPGVLLLDGHFAGTWRGQKKDRRFNLAIELASPLQPSARQVVEDEAQTLAPLKDCAQTDLLFLDPS